MVDSFILVPVEKGTKLIYEMDYTPPYRSLGRIWYKLFVNKHIDRHLEYTVLQMKRNAEGISRLKRPRNRS
jgi:hypothetical protein